ncbi:MAG: hypothetical protein GY841_13600 [FCB group bacterium]|nr:hypothetical protein [FCB group bacterium]
MAATYTKPTFVPRWADTTGNISTPSEAQKNAGHVFEAAPPSSFENWRTKAVGNWLKWLNERFDDGSSGPDDFKILNPIDGSNALFIDGSEPTMTVYPAFLCAAGATVAGDTASTTKRGIISTGAAGGDAGSADSAEGIYAQGGSASDNAKVSGTGLYAKGGPHTGTGQVGRGIVAEAGTVGGSDDENAALKVVPQTLPTVDLQNGDIIYDDNDDLFKGVQDGAYVAFAGVSNPGIELKATTYTATAADNTIVMRSTGAATVSLPGAGLSNGHEFTVINATGNSDYDVTVDIDGSGDFNSIASWTSKVLTDDGWVLKCQWDSVTETYWITLFQYVEMTILPP